MTLCHTGKKYVKSPLTPTQFPLNTTTFRDVAWSVLQKASTSSA